MKNSLETTFEEASAKYYKASADMRAAMGGPEETRATAVAADAWDVYLAAYATKES